MASVIVPTAKPLLLCEETDVEGGMVNVYALFNAIHPTAYPHTHERFRVFAQLSNGLGEMSMHFDIRRARDYRLIHTKCHPNTTIPAPHAVDSGSHLVRTDSI